MCCRVAACCCITDLRFATLIIAVLSLLGNVGLLALTLWYIRLTRVFLLVLLNDADSGQQAEIIVRGLRAALAFLALMLVICIVAVVLDVVLFFGTFRRRRALVQCWCHGRALVSGACFVYCWVAVVGLFADGFIGCGVVVLAGTIVGAGVSAYFWVVVRSYDLRLQRAVLSTVSESCAPTIADSNVPASRAAWEADKRAPRSVYAPPPYSILS